MAGRISSTGVDNHRDAKAENSIYTQQSCEKRFCKKSGGLEI